MLSIKSDNSLNNSLSSDYEFCHKEIKEVIDLTLFQFKMLFRLTADPHCGSAFTKC